MPQLILPQRHIRTSLAPSPRGRGGRGVRSGVVATRWGLPPLLARQQQQGVAFQDVQPRTEVEHFFQRSVSASGDWINHKNDSPMSVNLAASSPTFKGLLTRPRTERSWTKKK